MDFYKIFYNTLKSIVFEFVLTDGSNGHVNYSHESRFYLTSKKKIEPKWKNHRSFVSSFLRISTKNSKILGFFSTIYMISKYSVTYSKMKIQKKNNNNNNQIIGLK